LGEKSPLRAIGAISSIGTLDSEILRYNFTEYKPRRKLLLLPRFVGWRPIFINASTLRALTPKRRFTLCPQKTLFIEFQPISEILAKISMIGRLQVAHITRLNAENRTRERKKCLKAALCADSVTAI
jgi:hypothetical protein